MSKDIVINYVHVRRTNKQSIKPREEVNVRIAEVSDAETFIIARVAEISALTQARIASCSAIQASQLSSGRFLSSSAGQALNQQV